MQQATSWADTRTQAAKAFVKTVVIVDDHPDWLEVPEPPVDDVMSIVPGDGRPLLGEAPAQRTASAARVSAPLISGEPHKQRLRVTDVVDAFAEHGVVCAPIIGRVGDGYASTAELVHSRVLRAADAADILILDWSWANAREPAKGDFVMKVLDNMVSTATSARPACRQRMVVVYTGEDDGDQIWSRLSTLGGSHDRERMTLSISDIGLSIAVIQKPEASNEMYENSKCAESQLPQRLFEIFGALAGGVLGNAAMHALGRLRTETHRVLRVFGPRHDSAFVVHRAFNHPVSDAEDQVVAMIADSVQDALEDAQIAQFLGEGHISAWLAAKRTHAAWHSSGKRFTNPDVAVPKALAVGIEKEASALKSPKSLGSHKPQLMQSLVMDLDACTDEDATARHESFARTIYCTSSTATRPALQLGTIVRDTEGQLLLCIQPLCDTARVPSEGALFLFVPMLPERDKERRDLVAEVDRKITRYAADVRSKSLVQLRVAQLTPDGPIRALESTAEPNSPARIFKTRDGVDLEYVGRLRPMIAQDILTRVSKQLGRVGLMESEYIRIGGK